MKSLYEAQPFINLSYKLFQIMVKCAWRSNDNSWLRHFISLDLKDKLFASIQSSDFFILQCIDIQSLSLIVMDINNSEQTPGFE